MPQHRRIYQDHVISCNIVKPWNVNISAPDVERTFTPCRFHAIACWRDNFEHYSLSNIRFHHDLKLEICWSIKHTKCRIGCQFPYSSDHICCTTFSIHLSGLGCAKLISHSLNLNYEESSSWECSSTWSISIFMSPFIKSIAILEFGNKTVVEKAQRTLIIGLWQVFHVQLQKQWWYDMEKKNSSCKSML